MTEDIIESVKGNKLAVAGTAAAVAAGGISAVSGVLPVEKLLDLGMGGAAIFAMIFVVNKFLAHLKSESKANRETLAGLDGCITKLGDKLDAHAQEMRSLFGHLGDK